MERLEAASNLALDELESQVEDDDLAKSDRRSASGILLTNYARVRHAMATELQAEAHAAVAEQQLTAPMTGEELGQLLRALPREVLLEALAEDRLPAPDELPALPAPEQGDIGSLLAELESE